MATSGTGPIEPLMTLEVSGGIDAGVDIAFSPAIGAQIEQLVLDVPAANLGTIPGFSAGNTIVLEGSLYSAAVFAQGGFGRGGYAETVRRHTCATVFRGRRGLRRQQLRGDAEPDWTRGRTLHAA